MDLTGKGIVKAVQPHVLFIHHNAIAHVSGFTFGYKGSKAVMIRG
jgi:hypothetical protein